jgi:hypothetical protein
VTSYWSIVLAGILVAVDLLATNRTQISSSISGLWEYNTLTGALGYCWTISFSDLASPADLAKIKDLEGAGFSDDEINEFLENRIRTREPRCSPLTK